MYSIVFQFPPLTRNRLKCLMIIQVNLSFNNVSVNRKITLILTLSICFLEAAMSRKLFVAGRKYAQSGNRKQIATFRTVPSRT